MECPEKESTLGDWRVFNVLGVNDDLNSRTKFNIEDKADLVAGAGSALGNAVLSVAKCEAMLMEYSEESCKKLLQSILNRLKTIKDDIGEHFRLFNKKKIQILFN